MLLIRRNVVETVSPDRPCRIESQPIKYSPDALERLDVPLLLFSFTQELSSSMFDDLGFLLTVSKRFIQEVSENKLTIAKINFDNLFIKQKTAKYVI